MSKRREARIERARRTVEARVVVAEVARLRRIAETQAEVNALAESYASNPDGGEALMALMATERGVELRTYNSRQSLPPIAVSPRYPSAPRNSGLQEAVIDALADGLLAPTGAVIARLGTALPTPAQRVTVSRALSRLHGKGLVEAYRLKDRRLTGDGRLWRVAPLAEPGGNPNSAKPADSPA